MRPAKVLIVGGAGYIGSVCATVLRRAGHTVVTYDNLSTGYREAVDGPLVEADVADTARLTQTLRDGAFDAVLHFAARIAVGESVREPLGYYRTNVGGTLSLLAAMEAAAVRALVFSSTAAVYGDPVRMPIDEAHPLNPVNPYGHSKRMIEQVLADVRAATGLSVTTLRYFNAAGATLDGRHGEAHEPETHLIPLALDAALGYRPPLSLYGDDYDTPDGTCVRDYIHVLDLASAHLLALDRLLEGSPGGAYNVGTGSGTTVRAVLDSVARVTGSAVPYQVAPRRPGDPPALVASSDKLQRELGWTPRYASIDDIVGSAAQWAKQPRYGPKVGRRG